MYASTCLCRSASLPTSAPKRTQPIARGAWINTVIFNDPPEPPPADVPPLPEADEDKLNKLTIRERFEEHRKREDCASCHNQIDPLGFALENYGPTGQWRDKYQNGRAVDLIIATRADVDPGAQHLAGCQWDHELQPRHQRYHSGLIDQVDDLLTSVFRRRQ